MSFDAQFIGESLDQNDKTVWARPQVPWYNADIAKAKRRRRKAERRWRRTRLSEDLEMFKRLKNHVTHISTKARRNFYSDFMRENGGDQGRLFRATRALLLPKDDFCFPDYVDSATLANDIGRFFYRKIINIRTDLDAAAMEAQGRVHHDAVFDGGQTLYGFTPLSTEEVKKLIQKSSKKSCALDTMPTSLVVSVIDELLPSISIILNSSLSLGYFPEVWKAALVDPRLKKSGQAASLTNLRPVSNLQFISKLTERAVSDQTAEHVSRSGLYPLLQSAYRAGHSTEKALLKVQNDILLAMDRQHVTLLVRLDLSAAFDTVNHRVLLRRLEVTYGITGTALQWFRSYLTGRTQRVYINQTYSDDFPLPHGVPQGSCLGPLLFMIYASKLFEVAKNHLPNIYAYADDTQIYLSFKPYSTAGEQDAITALQDCISDIRSWMIADRLKLNDDKTEFMIIGTRAQLDKVNVSEIVVGQTKVPAVTIVRNLGTWLDTNLTMSAQINKTCQAVIYHLYNIKRISRYLSHDDRKSIVQAVIMSRIDYCNSLLVGVPSTQLSKLQLLQNAAARPVSNVAKYDHITPTLVNLHWLPGTYRVNFKIAMLAHKCIYGNALEYLKDLIN